MESQGLGRARSAEQPDDRPGAEPRRNLPCLTPKPALTHFLRDVVNPRCISARPTGLPAAPCNAPLVWAAGRNRQNPRAGNLGRAEPFGGVRARAWFSSGPADAVGCLQENQSFNWWGCGFAWSVGIRQPRLSYSLTLVFPSPCSSVPHSFWYASQAG